jgi:dTDP-4-amino-4,6-dideoxygalactose transaminase
MKADLDHAPIPLVDLGAQYVAHRRHFDDAIERVMSAGDFTLGRDLAELEREFAAYCRVPLAIGVSSGLAALRLALTAAGIGTGDEVITAANTYAATVLAILHAGAKPVLVDVDATTSNIDPAQIESAISSRTRAIMPVHLYGHLANMELISKLAKRRKLQIIEDAAQAHGAQWQGHAAGSFGLAGCFSFYPSKNLGAAGDGGAIVTSSAKLDRRLRVLRNYGQQVKYKFSEVGFNERLDTLQAAILRVKLHHLDSWNELRRRHAALYDSLLAGLPITLPVELPGYRHVYYVYVIRTKQRDALAAYLAGCGIATGIHYPIPLHRQRAFAECSFAQQRFPVTERLSREILSLPMYPELAAQQVERIAEAVRRFFDKHGTRKKA